LGVLFLYTNLDFDTRCAQAVQRTWFVRSHVPTANNHPFDARRNYRLGARSSPAMMVARLKGYVERRSARALASSLNRDDFRMSAAAARVISNADKLFTHRYYGTDMRIRARMPVGGQSQRPFHERIVYFHTITTNR
jgi:hypothetical protein